jgi:hypothetical protein
MSSGGFGFQADRDKEKSDRVRAANAGEASEVSLPRYQTPRSGGIKHLEVTS